MIMAKKKHLSIEYIDDCNCLINDTIVKLSGMGGCRRKGFYENYIIKFEEIDDQFQNEREIFLWKTMEKSDRKYFPKLISYSTEHGYIVQERIRFQSGRKAKSHHDTIKTLIEKYSIEDISLSGDNDNWSVRRDNGLPVIYDYGAYS